MKKPTDAELMHRNLRLARSSFRAVLNQIELALNEKEYGRKGIDASIVIGASRILTTLQQQEDELERVILALEDVAKR